MVTYSHFEQLKRYFIYEKVSNRNWLTHNKDLEKISAQIFQKKSDNLQNVALGLASLISNVHHHLLL